MSNHDYSDEALAKITDESFIEDWVNSFESDSYKVKTKPCISKFNLLKSCLKKHDNEYYRCKEEFVQLDDCTSRYFSNSIAKMGGDKCSYERSLFIGSSFDTYEKVLANERVFDRYEQCVQINLKKI